MGIFPMSQDLTLALFIVFGIAMVVHAVTVRKQIAAANAAAAAAQAAAWAVDYHNPASPNYDAAKVAAEAASQAEAQAASEAAANGN